MIIRVPATSANLGPGFDTLGLAINMYNTVTITPSKFISISTKGEGSDNPKLKNNNMFTSIFYDHFERATGTRENFKFAFVNKIPISRGLGSSSSIIISAIASAYAMAGVVKSKQEILDMALMYESHPDNISPAVFGGFCVAVVENNGVKVIKKEIEHEIQAVVVVPDKPMSTSHGRKILPSKYTKEQAVFNLSHSSFLVAAMMSKKYDLLKLAAQDMFHEDYRMRQLPILYDVRDFAYQNGAILSTLSGSGSTFFNIVHKDDARVLTETLREKFPNFFIRSYYFDNIGFKME